MSLVQITFVDRPSVLEMEQKGGEIRRDEAEVAFALERSRAVAQLRVRRAVLVLGVRVYGLGFRVQGLGLRIQGLGFGV